MDGSLRSVTQFDFLPPLVHPAVSSSSLMLPRSNRSRQDFKVISANAKKDARYLSRLIEHGAFDILRLSADPSGIVRQALCLYQLRLAMHNRRQRLEGYRRRYHSVQEVRSERQSAILKRTITDIEQTNVLCERTIHHIESSLRILESASRQLEARAMECAMRTLRMIETGSSSVM